MAARSGAQEWERTQRRLEREAQQQQRAQERARLAAEREAKQRHVEEATALAARKTAELDQQVEQLDRILRDGVKDRGGYELQRRTVAEPLLDLGPLATPVRRPDWAAFAPAEPGAVSRLLGGRQRYERALTVARDSFEHAVLASEKEELERQRRVGAARREHRSRTEQARREVAGHNRSVETLRRGVRDRDKTAVEDLLAKALDTVPVPAGFPHRTEVIVNSASEQVVVRAELPARDVVPSVRACSYVAKHDEQRTSQRPAKDVAAIYRSVVSQVALLCVRDVFAADLAVRSVAFNGHLPVVSPAMGEREYPCLLSVEVAREDFPTDDKLRAVTPEACLRHLRAVVSPHPYEVEPVEPILDFDLSKYRFVEGLDAVSTLDSRPDLMQMSYTGFEHLVRQLFEAQGAEGWTTERSGDDGVDAVIARRTPLFGGLSIVQAKQYSQPIGLSHLRELAGAMEEKKAGWGVLVTTSRFTSGCATKAREHGRMELIDGQQLRYLIKEHLGKDVLIGKRPRQGRR